MTRTGREVPRFRLTGKLSDGGPPGRGGDPTDRVRSAEPSPYPRAMTLQHVTFEVTREQVEPHLAFWAMLGYEEMETPEPLQGRAVWMRRGGSHVHLLLDEEPVVPPRAHAAFVVEDWDATLRALHAAGYESRPAMRLWECERAYLRAPGGHRVEIMSSPPPAD